MTKKHTEKIAHTLALSRPSIKRGWNKKIILDSRAQWEMTVRDFANLLGRENAGFKREKFIEAAGYNKID